MVRCRKKHKGKEKVVRARGKRPHRARTALCTACTARAPFSYTSTSSLTAACGVKEAQCAAGALTQPHEPKPCAVTCAYDLCCALGRKLGTACAFGIGTDVVYP